MTVVRSPLRRFRVLVFCLSWALAACGSGGGGTGTPVRTRPGIDGAVTGAGSEAGAQDGGSVAADAQAPADTGNTTTDAANTPPPDTANNPPADAGPPDLPVIVDQRPADAASPGAEMTRTLMLPARHLAADPIRKLLYATVAGTAPMHANSLVVLDAADLSIKHSIPIGSDPGSLAVSADAGMLWVGIDGSFSVRKVDLTTSPPTPGATFPLPKGDSIDTAAAGPLAVLPGSRTTLAVSLHRWGLSPSFSGAALLDDGVPRAMQTRGHTGAARLVAGPPGFLFGYNNLHTGFEFFVVTVSPGGLTQTEHRGLINGFNTDIVQAGNRVYATSGEVVDVSVPGMPRRAGKFGFAGLVAPRPAQQRVFMISSGDSFNGTTPTFRVLDDAAFTQTTSAPLPVLGTGEWLFDLGDLGDHRLAFLVAGARFAPAADRVILLSSPLLLAPP